MNVNIQLNEIDVEKYREGNKYVMPCEGCGKKLSWTKPKWIVKAIRKGSKILCQTCWRINKYKQDSPGVVLRFKRIVPPRKLVCERGDEYIYHGKIKPFLIYRGRQEKGFFAVKPDKKGMIMKELFYNLSPFILSAKRLRDLRKKIKERNELVEHRWQPSFYYGFRLISPEGKVYVIDCPTNVFLKKYKVSISYSSLYYMIRHTGQTRCGWVVKKPIENITC